MRPQLITRGATLKQSSLIPAEKIERTIYLIRCQKVMLDADLALLYQVTTKALNQAVRRNRDRFPADFMFQLTTKELGELNRSQIVTPSQKHRDPRFRPYAFTEQGVAMLSSVLHSKRAVLVNIEIMRTFARLRLMLATNTELSRRLDERGSSPTVREGLANSKWSSMRFVSSWHRRRLSVNKWAFARRKEPGAGR
jgi:hypothetical protein